MPIVVLALAVAADYACVSRFRTRVQLAADAASAAATEAITRRDDAAGARDLGRRAERVAMEVFARKAPSGAGGATFSATSHASVVTATVGYQGVAPSNFGAALGYGAVNVTATAKALALIADSTPRSAARTMP